jgi:hypothetical protein
VESLEGKIEVSGSKLTCSPSYDATSNDIETTKIDTSFVADFMSPGSFVVLCQLDVFSRDEGTTLCDVTTRLEPYGDPTVVLHKLGVEALSLVYLEDGHFNSLTLSLPELQSLVISEDYSVQGVLSEEAAQGLHWLMYQLTQTSSLPAPRCTFPFQAATTVISFDVNCSSAV